MQQRNIVGVIAAAPRDIAKKGVLLRKFGQEVIRVTAGKRVHGTGSIPGGVNWPREPRDRDDAAAATRADARLGRGRGGDPRAAARANRRPLRPPSAFPPRCMSWCAPDGALDLYDGVLRARDADGRILFDHFDLATRLPDLITETVVRPGPT